MEELALLSGVKHERFPQRLGVCCFLGLLCRIRGCSRWFILPLLLLLLPQSLVDGRLTGLFRLDPDRFQG